MSSIPPLPDAASVVVADDHALVRGALTTIFGEIGATVAGEAAHGLDAIALCKTLRPALLTLDSAMPLAGGMEVYGEVRRWAPETRICLVTGLTARGHLAEWVAAGVDGAAFKSCPPEEMRDGFALMLRGGGFLSRAVMAALEDAPAAGADLTQRERQILHLLAQGRTNAEIGERLSISAKTVDNHRTRLMGKLGVHSMAQLLAHALREGLLDQNAHL